MYACTYEHVCTHARMHTRMHLCMHVGMSTYIRMHVCMSTYVRMHVCIRACTHAQMSRARMPYGNLNCMSPAHAYTYTHACIHTHACKGESLYATPLAHKFLWEGVPLKCWLPKVEPEFKWIIKRVLRENIGKPEGVIVNWLPLRRALYLSINRDDPTYVRHLFDLQPQRN